MKKRKPANHRSYIKTFVLGFSPLFLLLVLGVGSFFWYQSRTISDLNEEHQMTTLPWDVFHVLGAKVGISLSRQVTYRVPMLLYHYVEYVHNDPGRQKLTIPPDVLTSQIETLKSGGYTFITPNDVSVAIEKKQKLSQKSIILSFDDGYMDFYTDVFPILKKEHVRAVAYIVPNFLDRPNYMFIWELQEVAHSPYVEIGAHTMDHYALAGLNSKEVTSEVVQSRKVLQNMLHLPINSFAYPYGSFDASTIQIVEDAGFTNAASVIPGIMQSQDNKYFMYRLRPGYRTGHVLLGYLQQDAFQPW